MLSVGWRSVQHNGYNEARPCGLKVNTAVDGGRYVVDGADNVGWFHMAS
jgi:hypothetical protein